MSYIWKQWLKITKRFSAFLATIVLTIVYWVIIVPIAMFLKLVYEEQFAGHANKSKANSYWVKKMKVKQDLKWAKEQ